MLFQSSPVIQVHFKNGVSGITLPRPLSTQDKQIIAAKKKRKERRTEIKKEEKKGRKEI